MSPVRLASEDSVSTVRLSRAAFAPDLHELLVHCQEGYDRFVRSILGQPAIDSGREFWQVQGEDSQLLGFAEFRTLSNGKLFLNHIAVHPAAQGLGVGRSMLRAFAACHSGVGPLDLDVFVDHNAAVGFYEHVGFNLVGERQWWIRKADNVPELSDNCLHASEIHVLLAGLRTFGFGTLEVVERGVRHKLSFPSSKTIRLSSRDDLSNDSLLSGLLEAFPSVRRFVNIGELSDRDGASVGQLDSLRAIRMRCSLQDLRLGSAT